VGKPTDLAKAQQSALARLSKVRALRQFYLAGGTAIAHHLGHRQSFDLDLFSLRPSVDLGSLARTLVRDLPGLEVLDETDAVLKVKLGETAIDVVCYPYAPLAQPETGPAGFAIAGLLDLAVMKLAAIASRGIRRDFWDLYEILQHGFTLREVGDAYLLHYKTSKTDLYHVARALTFFSDAEKDPALPAGLSPRRWGLIKRFFEKAAPLLLQA